jgi:hypothetical protein
LKKILLAGSGVIACFSVSILLLSWHRSTQAHQRFANMTYQTTSPYIVEKLTLVDGYCITWNGRLHHTMHYEDRYVYGDFNHDGLTDATVVIAQGEGGSGHFRELAFLINDGTQLVHRVSHYLGDRVIINSLKELNGKVMIDMFVHRENDCRAGPTKRMKYTFDYLNPDLDRISKIWTT